MKSLYTYLTPYLVLLQEEQGEPVVSGDRGEERRADVADAADHVEARLQRRRQLAARPVPRRHQGHVRRSQVRLSLELFNL